MFSHRRRKIGSKFNVCRSTKSYRQKKNCAKGKKVGNKLPLAFRHFLWESDCICVLKSIEREHCLCRFYWAIWIYLLRKHFQAKFRHIHTNLTASIPSTFIQSDRIALRTLLFVWYFFSRIFIEKNKSKMNVHSFCRKSISPLVIGFSSLQMTNRCEIMPTKSLSNIFSPIICFCFRLSQWSIYETKKESQRMTTHEQTKRKKQAHRSQHGFDGDKIAKCFAANNNNNRHQYAISVIIYRWRTD